MFKMETVIHQIIVVVIMVLKIANIQFVFQNLQMIHLFVLEMVNAIHQIILFEILIGLIKLTLQI
jgi:hypothetical protein